MKEALKLALEALNSGADVKIGRVVWTEYDSCLIADAITAIKEALAQPEHAEQMARLGWQYFECPACGSEAARAFPKPEQPTIEQSLTVEQEPVAWRTKNFYENQEGWFYAEWHQDGLTPQVAELLYTTPPQRTWVTLRKCCMR